MFLICNDRQTPIGVHLQNPFNGASYSILCAGIRLGKIKDIMFAWVFWFKIKRRSNVLNFQAGNLLQYPLISCSI